MKKITKILDLFCGAGGASMGLHKAFPNAEITGVDNCPQPRYPFKFIQADAMKFSLKGYNFIWASPPCQRYSVMTKCRPGLETKYADLVGKTRERLEYEADGAYWILENVVGAPLKNPVTLCGFIFGLPLYRHRIFEGNFHLQQPEHLKHTQPGGKAGHWKPGEIISVSGHCSPMWLAKKAMGIDWMNRNELSEAIPPAYSMFIANELKKYLKKVV